MDDTNGISVQALVSMDRASMTRDQILAIPERHLIVDGHAAELASRAGRRSVGSRDGRPVVEFSRPRR